MGTKIKAAFISPMLLLATGALPEGPDWDCELKLDGYRALAIKSGGRVRLRSGNDKDFAGKYPLSMLINKPSAPNQHARE